MTSTTPELAALLQITAPHQQSSPAVYSLKPSREGIVGLWMIIVTETYDDEEESILQVALLWTQGVAKATMGFKRHMCDPEAKMTSDPIYP
ncbi:hypothetical protein AVEN_241939-1 [Araneus ventricosus]|uniref:Uncharacterized protein n=1 Tax=Araneus ventricosus TaxID=182803 RepID=A0A4Y2PFF0_ARAVE|nr:hypothetical protein AVEN_241939-1 [Araneus ventricosus]